MVHNTEKSFTKADTNNNLDDNSLDLITCESDASIDLRNTLTKHDIVLQNKILGSGCFSKVRYGFSKKEDKFVAIKQIDLRQKTDFVNRFLPRELKIVKILNHPNIVKCYDIVQSTGYVSIIEEYVENGDLLHKIKKEKFLSNLESQFLMRQLIEALRYLSTLEIVHRDLKCENIFLDRYGNIKLGDFGFARHLPAGVTSKTFCGSKAYVALEILRATMYTGQGVDIWSSGVILYIMLTGCMPFRDSKPREMVYYQMKRKIVYPNSINISDDAKNLVYEMLNPDPSVRYNCRQILEHPWMKNVKYEIKGPGKEGQNTLISENSHTDEIDQD
ncbi:AT25266p [Strongyloides ratti]|uniref:AT25266p n=1 Tax=Strongyloides ratti TaxID=34506 RepID=A0A090LAW2_STRRB|nr:AT25266p [Strongyloides ratti]CEF65238.1 AT25266p [Strongyloides ratti]